MGTTDHYFFPCIVLYGSKKRVVQNAEEAQIEISTVCLQRKTQKVAEKED